MGNNKACAVIVAAGIGRRMKADTTKQKMTLGGISVLRRCVLAFERCEDISEIVVVSREAELEFAKSELKDITKLSGIVPGGACRAESAICGLNAVRSDAEFIAVHDAARPLITPSVISDVLSLAKEKGAATAAAKVTDTVKIINNEGKVLETPDRSTLVRATTPQIFKRDIYESAVKGYRGDLAIITDDNMLVEMAGYPVYTVISDEPNPKITTMEDIYLAELILEGAKNV